MSKLMRTSPPLTTHAEGKTWILWDGACGFCRRSVDWLLDQVMCKDDYIATPYQKAARPPMTDAIFERCDQAVHIVLPDGTVKSGGDACRYLLKGSRRPWLGEALDLPPISWLLEPGYNVVARHRRLLGKILCRTTRNKPPRNDVGDVDCCGPHVVESDVRQTNL